MKELKELKDQLDTMKHLQGTWEDIQVLIEMAHEENDESMVEEIEKEKAAAWEDMTVEEHMDLYLEQGMDRKDAMKQVAKDRGISKRDVYQVLVERKL